MARLGRASAADRRSFATLARGAAKKYHETITLAWIRLIAEASESVLDLDALLIEYPHLLDKNLLDRYYSPGVLQSQEARERWAEPDRKELSL